MALPAAGVLGGAEGAAGEAKPAIIVVHDDDVQISLNNDTNFEV